MKYYKYSCATCGQEEKEIVFVKRNLKIKQKQKQKQKQKLN